MSRWVLPAGSGSTSLVFLGDDAGLRTIVSIEDFSKRVRMLIARTSGGRPLWGRAVYTSLYGARLSSVPSGDRSVTPATPGASGHNDLQRVFLSASARKRSGPERLATSKKVFRTARSDVPCRSSASGHRASSSKHTRGQSRETGSLSTFLAAWKLLPNVSQWVLHTVDRGYKIQFGSCPLLFNGVFPTLVGPEQALVTEQEVAILLRKEATEVVPPLDRESGFYSRYFIVPKKDGGLRPILDL